MNNKGTEQLFFITGRGRSGTWLLQSILDRHPLISVAPEALFLINLKNKYAQKIINKENVDYFLNDLFLEKKLTKWWKIQKNDLKEFLFKDASNLDFCIAIKAVYRFYAKNQGKKNVLFLGDKNPEHSLFIRDLLDIYPASKFIHLIRDPRGNVASYKRVEFDLNNAQALALRWNKYNTPILSIAEEFPSQVMIIRFEDLIINTDTVLKSIGRFLKIDNLEYLLNTEIKENNIFSWNAKIKEKPDHSVIDKWKTELTSKEVFQIEKTCNDMLKKFQYKTINAEYNNSMFFSKLKGNILGKIINTFEDLVFKLPLKKRMLILNIYRKFVKVF